MKKLGSEDRLFAFYFVIPVIVTLIVFNAWPFFETIRLSFMKQERGVLIFNGIKNYQRLLNDSTFKISLYNSLIFYIIRLPIMLISSTLLASLLHRGIKHCKDMFRSLYFMPVVVDAVAYTMIFILLFQDRGMINYLLSLINIDGIEWFTKGIPARAMILIVLAWKWTGYNMVMFLAALQGIPEEQYEAATLDGASAWQKFLYITLPGLKPVIIFASILSTIGTLNLFTEPFLLTNGGPNNATMTLGLYIYHQAFTSLNLTYASTISVAILIIVGAFTALQVWLGGTHE